MADFQPSERGTKEYWDRHYELELDSLVKDGSETENWFGEQAMKKIVKWLKSHTDLVPKDAPILDLGCGSGLLCLDLASEGYGSVTGVDYSEAAIQLSREQASRSSLNNLTFKKCDIISDGNEIRAMYGTCVACIDKGTYDAISLNPVERDKCRASYKQNVHSLLKSNGYLIIASCNWTEEELENHFGQLFKKIEVLPSKTFSFGGQSGSDVTSVVFKKIV